MHIHGEIDCKAPFNLRHSLSFLCGFSPTEGEQRIEGSSLTKAFILGKRAVRVHVRDATAQRAPRLAYEMISDAPLDDAQVRSLERRIAFVLSADEDLAPFYAHAERDTAFAPVVKRLAGLHHVKFPTPFEAAVWGALYQRVPLSVARRMKTALTSTFGAQVKSSHERSWAFPEALALAVAGERALEDVIGHARKAKVVSAIARAFAEVDPRFLHQGDLDEVARWLRSIYGVGPFTSAFVLFRGLGRFFGKPRIAPRLALAASAIYRQKLDARDVEQKVLGYGPWGGHFMLYVWASTFVA